MNRPLFFTVIMFALGEVVYMIADESTRGGILFGMLLCCAFFVAKVKGNRLRGLVCGVALFVGYMRAADFVTLPVFDVLYSEVKLKTEQEENYTVSYYLDYYGISRTACAQGVVVDISKGNQGVNLTLKINSGEVGDWWIGDDFKVVVYNVQNEEDYHIGDSIKLKGQLCGFDKTTNPGGFDMKSYYFAKGILGYAYGSLVNLEKIKDDSWWVSDIYYIYKDFLWDIKIKLSSRLYQLIEDEYGGLFEGILLGEKDNIKKEISQMYRVNGISHILAISGLHISLIGMSIYKLLRRMGLKFWMSGILSFFLVLSYGIMSGMSFPTMRAVIMFALYLGSQITGRRNDILTSLAVALIILGLGSPYRLLDKGIWLSFGAMLGVYVSRYVVEMAFSCGNLKKLTGKKKKRLKKIALTVAMSFGVSLITTPIIAITYYQLPLYSPVINLLVIPLMTIVMISGITGLLISFFNMWLGGVLLIPGKWIFVLYEWVCNRFSRLPFALINTGKPSVMEVLVYYVTIVIILVLINQKVRLIFRNYWHKKTGIWLKHKIISRLSVVGITLCIVITGLCIFSFRTFFRREEIVFLDVGQGDGVLIKTKEGTNMVVDCGSAFEDIGEYTMAPALLYMGMSQVDYWFISHFDKDHISGFLYVMEEGDNFGIHIENLVVAEDMVMDENVVAVLEQVGEKGINIIKINRDDCIAGYDFFVRCVHPYNGFVAADRNEASLVLEYTSPAMDAIFLGDVGACVEEKLSVKMNVDIVKVAHHGSRYSTTSVLLEKLKPDWAVISCGRDNSYGHPHKATLERLEAVGAKVLRTDINGAIYIHIR